MSTAGPWELLKRLSSGGAGDVFVARPVSGAPDRRVAVKRMHPHLMEDRALRIRFLDEARIAARMSHPNVVQIFDIGMSGGLPWLAMELVEGVSLWTLLEHCRRQGELLPPPVVRLIASGLCDALTYAHDLCGPDGASLELVHRDVSPSNVLISRDGAVRLTDFGLARAVGNSAHTNPGGLGVLKVGYSAPELASGGASVDRRADVFSTGVTLFEAATLKHPYRRDGASDAQVGDAVTRGDALKAAELLPTLAALDRAISPRPDDRFGSARDLKDALAGETAAPTELGALVVRLCSAELARFFSMDELPSEPIAVQAVTVRGPDTVVTIIAPATPPRRRAAPVAAAVALLALVAALMTQHQRGAATSVVELADLEELELQSDSGFELQLPTLAVSGGDGGAVP